MTTKLDTLYKTDNKGGIRVWWVEIDGDKIRNVSGLIDGEKVESGWKLMKAKNIGKANETTPQQQALLEANALYDKQLGKGGYHRNIEDADKKKYIEPMLAKSYDDMLPIRFPCYSQPKYDGLRNVASVEGLYSRNGKRYVSVPHLEFGLMKTFKKLPFLVIDGEMYNHDLKDNFNEIASCVRKTKPTTEDLEKSTVIQYYIYDMVDPSKSFSERYEFLQELIKELDPDHYVLSETTLCHNQDELDACYASYIERGYEGQMVRYDDPYEIGKRSKSLIKRKEFITEEFEVVDILEGEGNWAGYAKTIRYRLDEDRIQSAGVRGSQGFTKALLENKDEYIGGQLTLRYFHKTPDGVPRFPVAIDFAKGKRDD